MEGVLKNVIELDSLMALIAQKERQMEQQE
jgi:hypothetical protein